MNGRSAQRLRNFLGADADAAAIGIFVILAMTALYHTAYFFAPLISAIVVGLLASPVADRLERAGAPASLAAAILLIATTAALAAIVFGLVQPLSDWLDRAPLLWRKFNQLLATVEEPLRNLSDLRESARSVLGGDEATVVVKDSSETDMAQVATAAPALLGQIMIFLGAYYFFLAGRKELKRSVAAFYIRRADQLRVMRLLARIERSMSRYLASITLINLCFGVAVAAMLAAMGMPQPYLWGAMAFALNFIPYLGPAVMAVTILSAGLIAFPTPGYAALAAGLYVAMNAVEGQFVTPSIVGRTATLNPFLVFCALAFGLWFWGAIGAFLAAPLLLAARDVAVDMTAARMRVASQDA